MNRQSSSLRELIHNLYRDYSVGRLDRVLSHFTDDVDVVSCAPADAFPFLGRRKRKSELATAMLTVHEHYEFLSYLPVFFVVERNDAAVIVSVRLKQRATGRIIQLLTINFLRFRDGRIYEMREFMDSVDLAEKLFGRKARLSSLK